MNVVDMLKALPGLSMANLAVLRAAIEHLMGQGAVTTDPSRPLYDVLAGLLGQRLPYHEFQRMQAHTFWAKNAPSLVSFIEQTWPRTKRSRIEHLAMTRLLFNLLIDDLKQHNIPVTLGTVSTNLARVPQLFDTAFPGYLQSGLANVVLEQMSGRRG